MKKTWLFIFSTIIACAIAFYSKKSPDNYAYSSKPVWKTFEKNAENEIAVHKTTAGELAAAKIINPARSIAQQKEQDENDHGAPAKNMSYLYRNERVLIGDIQKKNYQDDDVELEMINRPNQHWKDILGNNLIRFQNEETKVMVKEELPVIKIQNGRGRYLEQVVISYLFKNGNLSSYRALVDSETGTILETWDKMVNEKIPNEKRASLSLPLENESGIIAR